VLYKNAIGLKLNKKRPYRNSYTLRQGPTILGKYCAKQIFELNKFFKQTNKKI
jgi:hypothetical protein